MMLLNGVAWGGRREREETHDSRHFVRDELGWVIAIPILHQKVISQRPRQN